jgi:hypothetical protein
MKRRKVARPTPGKRRPRPDVFSPGGPRSPETNDLNGGMQERRAVAVEVERAPDNDRLYFLRHPHRRHYLRRIYAAERRQFEVATGTTFITPPSFALFVAVEEVFPGARLRAVFYGDADIDTDLSEEVSKAVFEEVMPQRMQTVREQLRRLGLEE